MDSLAADGTEVVDLLSFPTLVFLAELTVDSLGSSKGASVDSSAVDGAEGVDLLSFPALVFLLGGATADLVDPCTRAVVDASATDGINSGGLPCFVVFAFFEGTFLEEEAAGADFFGVL